MHQPIRKVLIAGGGTAGWMTAAWLSKILRSDIEDIVLIESEEIGTVGVGEATTPYIRTFNTTLGIDENEFIRTTRGTFKLGIEFINWGKLGHSYHHAFGVYGRDFGALPFHSAWLRQALADPAERLEDYSLAALASDNGKFMRPAGANSPIAEIAYAYQFDASLYAQFLRTMSVANGVRRVEGKIKEVRLRPDGAIDALAMEDGSVHNADLFIDCTGFRSLLLGEALKVGFRDWSHWLPCDRAIAVPCARSGPPAPLTKSTAHGEGWQWRIPLQHRDGNGMVFSSAFIDEDKARDLLLKNLPGEALADPRTLRFTTGRREKFWHRNCIAIGLSAGFLEPLESTSILLIQTGILHLQYLFPDTGFSQADIDAYNHDLAREYEEVRDFLILHYHVGERDDSEFWKYCRHMSIPEGLAYRLRLFGSRGRIPIERGEQFRTASWMAVMYGQGLRPEAPDPLSLSIAPAHLKRWLNDTKSVIATCCNAMPTHERFISDNCRATL